MSSLWIDSVSNIDVFNSLKEDLEADICIVGAGVFGLSCAYYLTKLGFSVVVLDKDKIGRKATGNTTAKITSQHDIFYTYLINSYGEKFARDYLQANEEAIKNIKDIIDEEKINCNFEYQSNYVYTTDETDVEKIKQEVDNVNSLGFLAKFTTKIDLPFPIKGAIQFKNQAEFNPVKYLFGLAKSVKDKNGQIYTDTLVTDVKKEGNLFLTYTNDNVVKSKYVIMASHYPFINIPGFYFSKMYQSTSYIIGVDIKKPVFDGMYISATSPVYSFRSAKFNDKEILLICGSDHKTGQVIDFENSYGALEKEAKRLYPDCEVVFRWNTRDCISLDKIPYIGEYSNIMPNMYVGTGFKKWGMTSSNVAANIIVDKIIGKENPYSYVFDSTRIKPIKNADEMKNILVQSVNSLLIDKLKTNHTHFDSIPSDSGGIIEINKQKIGIYKDTSGNLFVVNPICTHLGCLLSWNDVDKTWDCPCHGSRFDFMGKNLYDPAFKNLEIYEID